MSLNAKNKGNLNAPFQLMLNFDNGGKIAVSGPSSANYTVSGTGEMVKKGDIWGNEKEMCYTLNIRLTSE